MRQRIIGALALVGLVAGLVVAAQPPAAQAADASQFNPGYIIADQYFYDDAAMTQPEIQQFLDRTVGTCLNSNCLAVQRADTFDRAAADECRPYAGASQELASTVIFKVQQACGISAKVLLVTLQKEQGLLTNRAPSDLVLRKAMGFGCPDTAECDARYYGLYNQLYSAAKQLVWYRTGFSTPGSNFYGRLAPGQVSNVSHHPDLARCGSSPVLIQNFATAALYFYTPYQPNAAALGNLYGTGDSCSSYGNRNFWRMYTDWFGSPTLPPGSPIGEIEVTSTKLGTVSISGWAVDPTAPTTSVAIHALLGGQWFALTANQPNAAAEARHPGAGVNHGFTTDLVVSVSGPQRLCVYAKNVGAGVDLELTCRWVTIPDASPAGEVKQIWPGAQSISLWGWAVDRDVLDTSVQLHIRVNNAWFVLNADQPYPAPVGAVPGAGPATGFGGQLQVGAGMKNVCVYAVNLGVGSNSELGCWNFNVSDGSPVGAWRDAWGGPAGIGMWGWAAEIDAPTVDIHVRIDQSWAVLKADQSYPAAASLSPSGGDNHGWGGTIPAAPGPHQVCAWAVNTGLGVNLALGCRTVTVPSGSPIGTVVEAWGQPGAVGFWGWAFDPDVAGPIEIHVLLDGIWHVVHADAPNASVVAAYPGFGPDHGFGALIPVGSGAHQLCAYAVNVGVGANTPLYCGTIRTP